MLRWVPAASNSSLLPLPCATVSRTRSDVTCDWFSLPSPFRTFFFAHLTQVLPSDPTDRQRHGDTGTQNAEHTHMDPGQSDPSKWSNTWVQHGDEDKDKEPFCGSFLSQLVPLSFPSSSSSYILPHLLFFVFLLRDKWSFIQGLQCLMVQIHWVEMSLVPMSLSISLLGKARVTLLHFTHQETREERIWLK